MAHKGRPYPVAFRRDLNLGQQNNNVGWARRYIVTCSNLPPGIAGGLANKAFDCGPDKFTAPGRLFWTSEPELFFGFVFAFQCQATIVNGTTFTKEIVIFEAVNGVILVLTADPDQFSNICGFPDGMVFRVTFRDPFFFTSSVGRFGATLFPKLWSDGDPH